MIVRSLDSIEGTDRETHSDTWKSRRFLLADDGMGFSLHDTVLYAGTSTPMWYRNHVEAVYCIEGTGTLENRETGEVHEISPGTMYALDDNDKHTLNATTDLRMVCVFNPPVTGQEVHDADGAYPLHTPGE